MALGSRPCTCCVALVKCLVVLLAGVCYPGAQASHSRALPFPAHVLPQPPPRPAESAVSYPYICPYEETLAKVYFNQTEIDFSQFIKYAVKLPDITDFTMHYWFNLADASTTSTMFNYGLDATKQNNDLTVQLEVTRSGQQFFTVQVNDVTVSRAPVDPPLGPGSWHHALHSWSSATAHFSHFLDGTLINTEHLPGSLAAVRGGGVPMSGQHQRTSLNNGLDQGEGLNGWLTLFQLSSKPLGRLSSTKKAAVARLASQCSNEMEGDLISWKKTPRKGHGGASETLSENKVCGAF